MSRRAAVQGVVRRLIGARLDQILVSEAKRNIDASTEADGTPMAPLWADSYQGRQFYAKDKARRSSAKKTNVEAQTAFSFRKGGKPLLDTRQHLYNRLSGRTKRVGKTIEVTLRGPLIAAYHNAGFSTSGPNVIPLTLKAKRLIGQKSATGDEKAWHTWGLRPGIDYIMAWGGVTVPRRQFFSVSSPRLTKELTAAVHAALKGN